MLGLGLGLGLGSWVLGFGTRDLGLGTWDLGLGTWDLTSYIQLTFLSRLRFKVTLFCEGMACGVATLWGEAVFLSANQWFEGQ